jgi:hypothetical protein
VTQNAPLGASLTERRSAESRPRRVVPARGLHGEEGRTPLERASSRSHEQMREARVRERGRRTAGPAPLGSPEGHRRAQTVSAKDLSSWGENSRFSYGAFRQWVQSPSFLLYQLSYRSPYSERAGIEPTTWKVVTHTLRRPVTAQSPEQNADSVDALRRSRWIQRVHSRTAFLRAFEESNLEVPLANPVPTFVRAWPPPLSSDRRIGAQRPLLAPFLPPSGHIRGD